MKMKLIRTILILLFFAFLINIINSNFFTEKPVEMRSLENSCGEFPDNYIRPDISNDPNYVFSNDLNYEKRPLWDELNNLVLVNSFIECEHYFNGGWSFYSQEYYILYNDVDCTELASLKEKNFDNGVVYIQDKGIKDLLTEKNLVCIGSIQNESKDNDIFKFEILYSKSGYILISQIIPMLFAFLFIDINKKIYFLILILIQIFSQLLFNFNIGLNLLNSVSVFTTFTLVVIRLLKDHENNF